MLALFIRLGLVTQRGMRVHPTIRLLSLGGY